MAAENRVTGVEWVRRTLEEVLSIGLEPHQLDSDFDTLGLDSLEVMQLHQCVENYRDADVPFERFLNELRTPLAVGRWLDAGEADERPARARVPRLPPEVVSAWDARFAASRAHADAARPHLADHRAAVGFDPGERTLTHPIVVDRAAGATFVDVDGNPFVDFAMGFGVHLLGHAPPRVQDALHDAIARGLALGPTEPLAAAVAERITNATGHDRAAFYNSGTEAVMVAVRLARAVTGRARIVVFRGSYHGTSDAVLAMDVGGQTIGLGAGVARSAVADTVVLPYGAPESLAWIETHAASLAAVLVEPVQSRRPGLQPRAFLRSLRAVCTDGGAALIFDEMITGFRLGMNGAAGFFDVQPDLSTYGKVIGGGLPIGVVAGSSRFMAPVDGGAWRSDGEGAPGPLRTVVAGTFCQHPLAMAAANAVLSHLDDALLDALNQRTADLAGRLRAVFQAHGVDIDVHVAGSLFRFVHAGQADLFYRLLLLDGIYLWEGRTCFLSTAHTDEDVEALVGAVRSACARYGDRLLGPRRTDELGVTIEVPGLDLERLQRAFEALIRRRGDVCTYTLDGQRLTLRSWRSVVDGWSLGVLLSELGALYGGAELPAVPTHAPAVHTPSRATRPAHTARLDAPPSLTGRLRQAAREAGRPRSEVLRTHFERWLSTSPFAGAGVATPVAGQRMEGPLDAVGCHTRLQGPADATVVFNEDRVPEVSFGGLAVRYVGADVPWTAHDLVVNALQTPEGFVFEWKVPDTVALDAARAWGAAFLAHLDRELP